MAYQAYEYIHYWGEDTLEDTFLDNLRIVLLGRGLILKSDDVGIMALPKEEICA
jgi:hypothetical protein